MMSMIELAVWASPKWFPLWLIWLLIGFIGGYMTGRLKGIGSGYTALAILIGVIGGAAGGWAYLSLSGGGEQNEYVSMISSVVGCALLLWVLSLFVRNRHSDDGY